MQIRLLILLTLITKSYQNEPIEIWDTDQGKLINTLEGHNDNVWVIIAFGDSFLASSSEDQTIKIWNTKNGFVEF